MLGEGALGDLPIGDLADRFDTQVTFVGTATVGIVAITRREAILTDTGAQLVYAAELNPWAMSTGRV